ACSICSARSPPARWRSIARRSIASPPPTGRRWRARGRPGSEPLAALVYDAAMGTGPGGVYGRLGYTLLVPIGVFLLARISLPGVDPAVVGWVLAAASRPSFDATSPIGIFSVELNPIFSAALLVEVLALVIPRWR